MPRVVDIEVFNIARIEVDREAVRQWLDRIGADKFDIPSEESISDPALLVAMAGRRCYNSFQPSLNPNVTRVRSDYVEYFDNILSSGHGSVLEHAVYSYAIEGCSRVFTAEMNRHRAGWAISEGSLRYIRFDEVPFWMPECLWHNPNGDEGLENKKTRTAMLFHKAFLEMENNYNRIMSIWDMDEGDKDFHYKKKVTSAARRVIGMGVATGGVWTGNIRALRHVLALRTDPAAEEEIAHVFRLIAADVIKREPLLFGDFERKEDGSFVTKYRKV